MGFTFHNWLEPPHNREAFWAVREVTTTVPIRNASGRVHPLASRPAALDDMPVPTADGLGRQPLSAHLAATQCDAICVVRDGVVRYEWAAPSAPPHPGGRHLLMSVSKSMCATVLGAAVGRGDLALGDRVGDLAPELTDTSVADATVRHLIDMTAGTDFVEDYLEYANPDSDAPVLEYDRQANYRPLARRPALGVLRYFREFGTARPHGARFDYRSPLTNIVARVLELATGTPFVRLLERDLWEAIGAEHPADIIVDHVGFPTIDGGISCSVRDLARFGMVHVEDGCVGGSCVVTPAWVEDCATPDEVATRAWAAVPPDPASRDIPRVTPVAYRNAWWIVEPGRTLTGLGIFGQFCWVDRPSRTVIARFSTWPDAYPEPVSVACLRVMRAIADGLD